MDRQLAGDHLPFPFPAPLVDSSPDLSAHNGHIILHVVGELSADGLANVTRFQAAEESAKMME